ncbi:MAG TPA: MFS transporter [Polyangiales bacterium]|nr:MFS transporter [Polyangiales bacterium]
MPDPQNSSLWRPPLRWLTIGLTLTVVATAFEALAVATVLPVTSAELGGLAWYGWTFSAFMLANLVGISFGGDAADTHGPAAPFVWGVALFSGGLVISGLAPSMPVIVAGRCAQGFGAGLLSSVAYASIARVYAVELQPRMLATLSSAWVIPGMIGPGVASAVAHYASWRWVFLGLAPLPPLAACLVVPALRAQSAPPTRPKMSSHSDALQLALGSGAMLYGLSQQHGLLTLLLVPVGLALGVRGFHRLLPEGTLRARQGLPASLLCMLLLTAAFFGTEAFVPLALKEIRGQPVVLSGFALTTAAIFWTAGAWLPLRLAARMRRPQIVRLGLAILMLGLALTLAVSLLAIPAWLIVAGWGVTGLGMGLAFTTLSAAILEASPPGEEGATSASLQLTQVLGAALATGVGGAVVAAPFAGEPPRVGIGVVDLAMMSCVLVALAIAARVADAKR